jgi:transposase
MNGDSQSEPTREELIALIRAQAAEIAALKARVAELERRLGLDSSNSGKPPASDGLRKPPRTRSSREPSGKKPGGQKGHKGETLRQVAEPDSIVDHFPPSCAACGAAVTPA